MPLVLQQAFSFYFLSESDESSVPKVCKDLLHAITKADVNRSNVGTAGHVGDETERLVGAVCRTHAEVC